MNSTKISCPLSQAAQKHPHQPAIIFGTRAISYEQFEAYVSSTVKYIKKLGFQSGNKAAIVSSNSVEYIIVLFALWRMGALACPLSPRLPVQNLCEQVSNLSPDLFLSSSHKILSITKINFKKFNLQDLINFDIRDFSLSGPTEIDLDQDATIVYTSGTSHEPKAALHTYGNHYFNALGANENIPISAGDHWLLALPLYHVGGLGILFRTVLSGAAIVIANEEESLPTTIEKNKITHISLVPTQLYRILQDKNSLGNLPSLKAILVGGSSIPSTLLSEALERNLPIYLTYGLTEIASQVATTGGISAELNLGRNPAQFALKTLNHSELKISKDGEIWVKGKILFKGYFKNGKVNLPLTEDGWFKTGDLGKMNSAGNLIVTGRKDNMFISGGENIQPEEIEHCLYELKEIEKAIVLGMENEEFGFRPMALIKFKENNELSKDLLAKHLEKKLARFKIPEKFYRWSEAFSINFFKENRRQSLEWIKENKGLLKQIS